MSDIDVIMAKLTEIGNRLENLPSLKNEAPSEIIDTAELCRRLGISQPTLKKMRHKGQIPSISVGREYKFNWPKVVAALENSRPGKTRL